MHGLGIETHPNPTQPTLMANMVDQGLRNYTLAVIADDHSIGRVQALLNRRDEPSRQTRISFSARLTIDPDNLLLVCDNTCFDAGRPRALAQQTTAVEFEFSKQ